MCIYTENTDTCTDSLVYAVNISERRCVKLSAISGQGPTDWRWQGTLVFRTLFRATGNVYWDCTTFSKLRKINYVLMFGHHLCYISSPRDGPPVCGDIPASAPFIWLSPLLRWLSSKESARNAGDAGLIPGLGRAPRGGNDSPLQYSCLGNPMDRGAWRAIVHGAAKESDTTERLNNLQKPPSSGALSVGSTPEHPLRAWPLALTQDALEEQTASWHPCTCFHLLHSFLCLPSYYVSSIDSSMAANPHQHLTALGPWLPRVPDSSTCCRNPAQTPGTGWGPVLQVPGCWLPLLTVPSSPTVGPSRWRKSCLACPRGLILWCSGLFRTPPGIGLTGVLRH